MPVPVPVPGGPNEVLEAADVGGTQALDHERLDVYHLALDFLVVASSVIQGLPRGRSHLANPFTRASMSVMLNIAESAGKVSKGDKRRDYLTARGSATESAALLDACLRPKLLDAPQQEAGKQRGVRIVAMLIRLAQACEEPRTGPNAWPEHGAPDRDDRRVNQTPRGERARTRPCVASRGRLR